MGLKTLDKPSSIMFRIISLDEIYLDANTRASVIALEQEYPETLANQNVTFVQTEDLTTKGIAVQSYGAFILNTKAPTVDDGLSPYPIIQFSDGTQYEGDTDIMTMFGNPGAVVTFEPLDDDGGDGPGPVM